MCANHSPGLNRYQALDHAADMFERTWLRLTEFVQRMWHTFSMTQKVEAAKQYAIQHPIVTLCFVLTLCMCSIPVMCFLFFVMGSLFLTFLGFMFVEGFLLSFASVLLGGALFLVGLLSIGASGILAIAWCLLTTSSSCFSNLRNKFSLLRADNPRFSNMFQFMNNEDTNGECAREPSSYKSSQKEE